MIAWKKEIREIEATRCIVHCIFLYLTLQNNNVYFYPYFCLTPISESLKKSGYLPVFSDEQDGSLGLDSE